MTSRPSIARTTFFLWTVFGIVVSVLSPSALRAQQGSGELRLQVKDSSGAAMQVPGTISDPATGFRQTFETDAGGNYSATGLTAGKYQVQVQKPGFATQVIPVDVQGSTPVLRMIVMELASAASRIDVVAATPLAGTDLTLDQVAGAVQTATATDVAESGAVNLADFMNRRLNGVYLNEVQENPFQPDVNFRGYTASSSLGTPEGVSVYVDGVRQNQPFGDVVGWDLIPKNAISDIALMPGSDPLFGLNTLGGALSVQTKSGLTTPGFDSTVIYGSSGRKAVQAQYGGGKPDGFNWFFAGTGFHESGWRIASPSDVRQGFTRLGWRNEKTDLGLTASYAYNTLAGNGLQDYRLLAANYRSVYTIPDQSADRAPSFNLMARHTVSSSVAVSGNAWFRNIRLETINPNFNTDALGNNIYQPNAAEQAALAAAGYTGFPTGGAAAANTPFPKWRCIANALQQNDPDERCDGVTVYSKEVQNDYGVAGQVSWTTTPKPGRNLFIAGGLVDRGSVSYTQNAVWGYINPDYRITNVPAWQDGTTNNPVNSAVSLHGLTPNWSLFFSDTLTFGRNFNLTLSGRYNRDTINNFDRLDPASGPGSLTGDYVFQRFNPSVGLTWSPVSSLNAYARFSQGSRAPTSIELGCADPENPCNLPNAFSSDPPLRQVVTDTWEAGLRGKPELSFARNLHWNVGAFRAENRNDILFVSSVQLGTGYFQNFATTRREGFDADLAGRIGRITWGLDYTYLEATYQSTEVVGGSANNTSDSALAGYPGLDGNIYVHSGNRIPLIPKQSGKAYADIEVSKKLFLDVDEVVTSSSYVRGNENNAYRADGVYYLGPGISPGYAITNLRAHYDIARHLQLAVQIDNLFDKHYYTAGQLANTGFNAQGAAVTRPFAAYTTGPFAGTYPAQSVTFFAPGAPRRAWVELRVKF